jgi:protein SCO1/2
VSRKTLTLALVGFFILLSAAFFAYYYKEYKARPQRLAVLGNPGHRIEPFSFTDQDGKIVTDKDVAGRIFVVEYFFTTCKGICPKMNDNMALVYAAFRGNDKVKILSHTVDPEKDSAGALKAYSLKFDADPAQWHFLTGPKRELYEKALNSYLITAVDDTARKTVMPDFIHTPNFVLIDGKGYIRGRSQAYDGTSKASVQQLIGDMKLLLAEDGK